MALPEAAQTLSRKFDLSARQAYRYLQEAAQLDSPVEVTRGNGTHHVEAPAKYCASIAHASRTQRDDDRCARHTSAGRVLRRVKRAWLSGAQDAPHSKSRFDYPFDRLLESKLAQAYDILVPGRERLIGGARAKESDHEDGSDLRPSVLGKATRGTDDRESDGGIDRVCQDSRSWRFRREWVFEDEGFSGAKLERPGLERIRDLAAEGQIQAVLAYSPDRLSRKYAYQILLIEELAKHGVETMFVNAPQGTSPEDQLLVQFQGMIAEYERAQILERSRRGKRHRARSGEVSVLSGAPYGYRYIRKTEDALAFYQVIDAEANIVRQVYEMYTVENLSIGEITRRLNARCGSHS